MHQFSLLNRMKLAGTVSLFVELTFKSLLNRFFRHSWLPPCKLHMIPWFSWAHGVWPLIALEWIPSSTAWSPSSSCRSNDDDNRFRSAPISSWVFLVGDLSVPVVGLGQFICVAASSNTELYPFSKVRNGRLQFVKELLLAKVYNHS